MHHMGGSRPNLDMQQAQPLSGYGRKDIDDMVINQHIMNNRPTQNSRYSSMETGYVSDGVHETQYTQPDFSHLQQPVVPQPGSSTHHYRDEVETEIF